MRRELSAFERIAVKQPHCFDARDAAIGVVHFRPSIYGQLVFEFG
jgi:hypothetical protein